MNKDEISDSKSEPNTVSKKISGKQLQASFVSLISLIVLSIIPYLVSLAVWYLVVASFGIWKLDSNLLLISYGVIILVLSLLIGYVLALVSEKIRYSKTKSKRGKTARWQRILITIISGLVIPVVISFIFYKVPLNGENTAANVLLETMELNSEISYVQVVGNAVINTDSIDTRIAGINALATFHTDESLEQLIGILDHYGCGFTGWTYPDYQKFSEAYSSAVASYGTKALDPLLEIFYKCDGQESGISTDTSTDFFSDNFEHPYSDLELLINQAENLSSNDKENFTDRLNYNKSNLEILLNDLGKSISNSVSGIDSEAAIHLVFQCINKMTLTDDFPILHTLSSRIAVDSSYHDATRIEAIALLVKVGSLDDLKLLLPNLEGTNEKIKQATLKAIDDLVSRAGGLQNNNDK